MLPTKSLRWLGNYSEKTISALDAFVDIDKAQYTAPDVEHLRNPWQGSLVKTQMNRVLESLAVAIQDELSVAFDQRFGKDPEWKVFRLHEVGRMTIAQASGRFTVGLPLCKSLISFSNLADLIGRNEKYLKDQVEWGELYVLHAGILGMIPWFLQPVLAKFLCRRQRQIETASVQAMKPTFDERMAHLDDQKWEEPQDLLQMMIRYAQTKCPEDLNLDTMAKRITLQNFGSIHQSSYLTSNLIFDMIDSNERYDTFNILREEVKTVLAEQKGVWNKATVAKLVKLDSVMRENLRVRAFTNRNVIRKVIAKEGVTTEDGIHLPCGTFLSVLSNAPQTDEEYFEDPDSFDPFRFSRLREESKEGNDMLAFVSLSATNLAFGSGKHACPGRFLLDFEMKMLVAYLITNYDIELAPEHKNVRPKAPWIVEATFPPMQAKVRVRRRVGEKI